MFGFKNRRDSGYIVHDGKNTGSTMQCVHCGSHFEVIAGSGRKRGWCSLCHGPTCGEKKCRNCVPFEAQLEYSEAKQAQRAATVRAIESRYPAIKNIIII